MFLVGIVNILRMRIPGLCLLTKHAGGATSL